MQKLNLWSREGLVYNSSSARTASLAGGGGSQCDQPEQDDLSWLRGVGDAPEYNPFDRPEGEEDNSPRKRRRSS